MDETPGWAAPTPPADDDQPAAPCHLPRLPPPHRRPPHRRPLRRRPLRRRRRSTSPHLPRRSTARGRLRRRRGDGNRHPHPCRITGTATTGPRRRPNTRAWPRSTVRRRTTCPIHGSECRRSTARRRRTASTRSTRALLNTALLNTGSSTALLSTAQQYGAPQYGAAVRPVGRLPAGVQARHRAAAPAVGRARCSTAASRRSASTRELCSASPRCSRSSPSSSAFSLASH